MKRRPNRFVNYLVYLLVRLVVGFAQAMSVEQSYAFAEGPGRRSSTGSTGGTARSAWRTSAQAFGDRYTEAERDRIVRGVYLHFCMMLMEILHIPRKLHPTTWRDRITLVGHEKVVDRLLQGRAADHADRPLRQLGDGRLPVRRLRLPAQLGGPDARQPATSTASSARSASGPGRR